MDFSKYLPDDSDEDGDGRTGLLSTRKEWHTLSIGFGAGVYMGASGNVQKLGAALGILSSGSRANKGLKDKYIEQVQSELPYFVAGFVLGFVAFKFGPRFGSLVPV
jgi:hypothetical protein